MGGNRFEFATAGRIIFGSGTVSELPGLAAQYGKRIMLVVGRAPERYGQLRSAMESAGLRVSVESVCSEPTVERVSDITDSVLHSQCECVVGLGGGSVIDAAKAAAVLANNPGDIMDYLEGVGPGHALPCGSLPCLAVPTTAGTGAEVTRNSVISVSEARVKVSLRSATMLPRVALVDPDLTQTCPRGVLINCAFDALCHLVEGYLSVRATPLSEALCVKGLSAAGAALESICQNSLDDMARTHLAYASLSGGLVLANSGLGAVHGFAGVIGGMYGAAHGSVCASLLAAVLKMNAALAAERNQALLGKFRLIALGICPVEQGQAFDCARRIQEVSRVLGVPRLRDLGVKKEDFPEIIAKSSKASSMKGNPFVLTHEQLAEILDDSW